MKVEINGTKDGVEVKYEGSIVVFLFRYEDVIKEGYQPVYGEVTRLVAAHVGERLNKDQGEYIQAMIDKV